jgi:fatty acid/phospholipid biosynthesis enzyme
MGADMTAICVDVMGSDKGPEVVLEGVAQALA